MSVMDSYRRDPALPLSLREALERNGKALEFYAALTPADRKRICREARRDPRPEAVSSLVDGLVGWEQGHPPYQL